MITPCLKKPPKGYNLDIKMEWTPATAVPTGEGSGPDKKYMRGKPTYHKALEVVVELGILEQIRSGNKAIIN